MFGSAAARPDQSAIQAAVVGSGARAHEVVAVSIAAESILSPEDQLDADALAARVQRVVGALEEPVIRAGGRLLGFVVDPVVVSAIWETDAGAASRRAEVLGAVRAALAAGHDCGLGVGVGVAVGSCVFEQTSRELWRAFGLPVSRSAQLATLALEARRGALADTSARALVGPDDWTAVDGVTGALQFLPPRV